ncbi:MAG TPA: asparagine synthase (glutamine-hydrolyzing) [Anaerohalosphaeraceae bacterium]|nr:asparagine synthase (glutamine-hydrolyzing) [Phycisphaerae bacterium]HOK94820.1 asparagine synthase (glutamine-hydrolyzing) [Anaerohalosphaeraceae bacterium]HOL30503.1 asparagine synthase (glutamine-hydrolyzing) [Anaerohalosphaeraceae bacterium]HOM75760.1 asparagine synthase (glutamine-hydrolyzing) [Anaerohalosphaeraceae bacterium]HPC63949.1 asparagine synthase (glutamine-hydrolyzing) [Anaerohalosphaeraceae bacterium]
MCGIAGFNWNDPHLIEQMTERLRHRGPDDKGYYCDPLVSLGHRRLSIIDLSERGRQPMGYNGLQIIYNGEIYNYRQLRSELESAGYRFSSDTDTEVILQAYHRWGTDCVHRFNGMWAFCIYDSSKKLLFLSRDRFGVKPLYYFFDGRHFVFASELKAIRLSTGNFRINPAAVNYFFYQKYIGDGLTIYDQCSKLRPSENLIFDLEKREIRNYFYFKLSEQIEQCSNQSVKERLDKVESLIRDAVSKRLVADVPVGSFLSGGLDSSVISAFIARQRENFRTFSIGFQDESYDEIPFSRKAAEYIRTKHHIEYLNIDESLIMRVISHMDEPLGDASILPTALLSQMTRRYVTVCLSGDGGDEVFAGYDSYLAYHIAKFIPPVFVQFSRPLTHLLPPSDRKLNLTFKMQKFIEDYHPHPARRHLDWMATFTDRNRRMLLDEHYIKTEDFIGPLGRSDLTGIQLNDFQRYLPEDILKKVDLASMMHSLEVRTPFLDYRLVPLVLSLPDAYKIRFFRTKWLLKNIAAGLLPNEIIHRPKRGFTVPISSWVKKSSFIRQFIFEKEFYSHGLINKNYACKLLDEHLNRQRDNARKLWLIFVFNYWHHTAGRQ